MRRDKLALQRALGLTVVASLAAGAAAAAEPNVDTSNWKCEQCPFYSGYQGEAEVGTFVASGANDSYGRYTGIVAGHPYVDAGASGALQKADGTYVKYDLQNLGLASRDGLIEVGQDGRFDLALSYDGQPNRLYDDTVTPFRGVGSGTLTLPSGWVHSGSTSTMTSLDSSLTGTRIGYDWRTLALSGQYLMGSAWSFYSKVSRQEKSGTDLMGASFLTQAVELPEPIDYVTTEFQAGARWSDERASLQLGYTGSWFDDDTESLDFANPYPPIVPGSTSGQLALPPSNTLQRVTASGDIHFSRPATTLTFAVSDGRLTQDQGFLPLSTLPATPALAYSSLDGDLRLTHYSLGLSSRPFTRLYLRGTASYDGRDDRTPVITVPSYIVTDTFPGGPATALRYGQDRSRAEGTADFTATRWLRLGVGGKYQEIHYAPGQVVDWTQDGQGWGRAIVTPHAGVTLTLKAGGDTRKASGFDVLALPLIENPALLDYDIAPRDERFYSLTGAWAIRPTLTWSLEGFAANDDYPVLDARVAERARAPRRQHARPIRRQERLSLYVEARLPDTRLPAGRLYRERHAPLAGHQRRALLEHERRHAPGARRALGPESQLHACTVLREHRHARRRTGAGIPREHDHVRLGALRRSLPMDFGPVGAPALCVRQIRLERLGIRGCGAGDAAESAERRAHAVLPRRQPGGADRAL